MKGLLAVLVLGCISAQAQTITETFGSGANQFSIEFVTIGNPGNSSDFRRNPWKEFSAGSVSYSYQIAKYETSRGMIDKFNATLNDSTTSSQISLSDMTPFTGNGPYKPASGVSWNEAARFVNWLNISRGYQPAYNFMTDGFNDAIELWSISDSAQNGLNRFRHKDAVFFLPSIDEWHKAAYYDPNNSAFSDYPTGVPPQFVMGGTNQGTAVFSFDYWGFGPADVSNAGGLSWYETMAQGGNVAEWNESAYDFLNDSSGDSRVIRGGSWYSPGRADNLEASSLVSQSPDLESDTIGFRVAMVPELSSLSLLLAGGAVLMAGRRRRSP